MNSAIGMGRRRGWFRVTVSTAETQTSKMPVCSQSAAQCLYWPGPGPRNKPLDLMMSRQKNDRNDANAVVAGADK